MTENGITTIAPALKVQQAGANFVNDFGKKLMDDE